MTSFADKIISMYPHKTTLHGIQGFLGDEYSTDASPELINSITHEIAADLTALQS